MLENTANARIMNTCSKQHPGTASTVRGMTSVRRYEMQRKYTYVCPKCGKSFIDYASNHRKFCSKTCSVSVQWSHTKEVFWARVDKSAGADACWLWTGFKNKAGYGIISWHNHPTLAHRLAYELTIGQIPDGLLACHKCDNPGCVNPEHIFIGTDADNMADKSRKERYQKELLKNRGANNFNTKLTWELVTEMRALYAPRKMGYRRLAEKFGVARNNVRQIIKQKTWKLPRQETN